MKLSVLSFVLACVLLSASLILASCGGDKGGDTPKATTAAAAEETTAGETEPQLEIPQVDYDGYAVKIITLKDYNGRFKLDMELDGDAMNDAGYYRNLAMEEQLNVTFEVTENDGAPNVFTTAVMAGDHSYDYVFPHASGGVAGLVTSGVLLDWNKLAYTDFTKPWWNQAMTESLSIGGHLYYASGDIVMAWQGMMATLFNKTYPQLDALEKDLYDTVFDGEWTLDYMTKIVAGVSADLDGNGVMDKADQYGLLDNGGASYVYLYSCGQRVTVPDEDGYPRLALNNERTVSLVEKLYNLYYSGDVQLDSYSNASYPTLTYRDMLVEGRAFLATLDIGGLYPNLREIEFDFGILPMPKLDETQELYRVFCGAGLIGVASNIEDAERAGVIMESMAYHSYKFIRPAFFDIVLENKAVRDDNSYRVIRMMHENKVFDFGFNFDATGSAFGMIGQVVVSKKSTDFVSHYTANEAKIAEGFDKIIEAVRLNEGD